MGAVWPQKFSGTYISAISKKPTFAELGPVLGVVIA